MARKKRYQWGITRLGPHEIKIFVNSRLSSMHGVTYTRKHGYSIEIHDELLDDPAMLDETLIHEFLHVVEFTYSTEWQQMARGDEECSAAVKTTAHGLAQMLRELCRV